MNNAFLFLSTRWEHRGHDGYILVHVVRFTATRVQSLPITTNREFESRLLQCVLDTTLFVSDLLEVAISGFLLVFRFPPPIKLTRHEIAELLLKVA